MVPWVLGEQHSRTKSFSQNLELPNWKLIPDEQSQNNSKTFTTCYIVHVQHNITYNVHYISNSTWFIVFHLILPFKTYFNQCFSIEVVVLCCCDIRQQNLWIVGVKSLFRISTLEVWHSVAFPCTFSSRNLENMEKFCVETQHKTMAMA